MLILLIIFVIHTVQVDYTVAFVQTLIDQYPHWHTYNDGEMER